MTDEMRIAQLEEQVRFFKAAYGQEEGTPQEIIHAATGVIMLGSKDGVPHPDVTRIMRHIIAQGNRAELAEKRLKRVHDALLNVSQVVANALELSAQPGAPTPPMWLLSLGSNLDMVLADAALERR